MRLRERNLHQTIRMSPRALFERPGFRRVRAFALLCAVLVAASPRLAEAAAPPAIVHPPEGAALAGGTIEVLGYLPAEAKAAELTVTGLLGSRSYAIESSGFFSVPVKLTPGRNKIELAGSSKTVHVAGMKESPPPGDFSAPDPHPVDNGCEDCHSGEADPLKLSNPVPELCAGCHDDVLRGADGKPHAVAHPPAEDQECLTCHVFHGLSIRRLPPARRRALCFECHDDFVEGAGHLHTPVATGNCTGCHGPHGGPGPKLLKATGTGLCLLCHADPAKSEAGEEWSVPHPALDDGCDSCHRPHTAPAPGVLRTGQAGLCLECHDPFPGALDDDGGTLARHRPVAEGRCAGCHAPHGSPNGKLLRGRDAGLCALCHEDPSKAPGGEPWATPHPALEEGCAACHTHHAGPLPKLLTKPQAPLCFECHEDFLAAPASGGQERRLHRPAVQGRCGSCHDPHGSAEAKLLLAPASRELCLGCHADPAQEAPGKPYPVEHPALEEGCPTCHAPHVSRLPKLLTESQKTLCGGCHEDKSLNEDGEPWRTPHAPVNSGYCSVCHGVHGSPAEPLLAKPAFELCSGCHPAPHDRHLRGKVDPKTGVLDSETATLPEGFPVRRSDGAFSCVGCHRPHGSQSEKLWNLPGFEFCAQCHTDY